MKRGIAAAVCLALLFTGCGKTNENAETPEQGTQQQEQGRETEMEAYLKELPEEVPQEMAVEKGYYTIANGEVAGGQESWDDFMAASEKGEEASVILCQYSAEGGAILDYVTHQAEGGYLVVSDTSRDGYEGEEEEYRTQLFSSLQVFEGFTMEDGGQEYTIGVLSNEPELDEETFRTYWKEMSTEAHQVYLLFVI